jgi:hypothetical protein
VTAGAPARAAAPCGRGIAAAAIVAVLAAGAASAGHAVPVFDALVDGPSIALSSQAGGSTYRGIGLYEGLARCTGFFLDTSAAFLFSAADAQRRAPAYAVVPGRCIAELGANEVAGPLPGRGRMRFGVFTDAARPPLDVTVARIAYATSKGRDVAVLELAATFEELSRASRPWPVVPRLRHRVGDPVVAVFAARPAGEGLRLSRCRLDGAATVVIEHVWHWFDMAHHRCRDLAGAGAGATIISQADRAALGIVTTAADGAVDAARCASGYPCEPAPGTERMRAGTNYTTPLAGLASCFDARGHFALDQPGCPLDPGAPLRVHPAHIGAVNPALGATPDGPARRRWHVAVDGDAGAFAYAIVDPGRTDCRAAGPSGPPRRLDGIQVVADPLPPIDGLAFLCLWAMPADGDWQHPTVVMARVDTTPPRLPAQVTIAHAPSGWQLWFSRAGDDVVQHAFKTGPPGRTDCQAPDGYRRAGATAGLPKIGAPYRVCVIPYDAAWNAGPVFERVLR